ncbi:mismatch repair endonuclease pms2 [Malassezia pachydermatis]|uniref:Mismatch repair endonuclease pms2 n=1 Tax=Malassezia pachydermatis TaxID=77020 RepID=A0A0M8MTA2_9BASI|nr:mismatch repair endonuclease pms2 [Malassezia pachydermatis]KOS13340.1 mismatch repair endonuclease pms2 [Malassezia pachydermatis]
MAHDARIAPLSAGDVRRMAGAQVVPDLRACVKELVENALDAGATSIEVRWKEYGLDAIEVIDNGSGIAKENYDVIGRRHHTSKLSSFEDLAHVQTFGFRGEALASLSTAKDAPMGTLLELASDGSLVSSEKRVARQRGTTVTLTDLLTSLPVRRRELERHVKREYNKAFAMLQAYALITQGVRWASYVTLRDGKRVSQLLVSASHGPKYLQANVAALFGAKASASMQPIDVTLSLPSHTVRVHGLVSKPMPGSGRSSGDRQYFYINGRPWDSSKMAHLFNQVYRTFNATQYPCIIVNLAMDTQTYDVNVSPDKRQVLLHEEAALLEQVREALETEFSPSRGVLPVHHISEPTKRTAPILDEEDTEPSKVRRSTRDTISVAQASWSQTSTPLPSQETPPTSSQRSSTSMQEQFQRAVQNFAHKTRAVAVAEHALEYEESEEEEAECNDMTVQVNEALSHIEKVASPPGHATIDELSRPSPVPISSDHEEAPRRGRIPSPPITVRTQDCEVERPTEVVTPTLPSDKVAMNLAALRARIGSVSRPHIPRTWEGADVSRPEQEAVAALERVISKSDFASMAIVGQFNLGFIIARRTTSDMDDLFIIDQHAADEKYNFEKLQRETRLHSQRLLLAQRLELAPSDELVAREHAAWLRMNGFEIEVDEDAPPGSRIQLLSKPVSKDTVFDLHDFEELLSQLRDTSSYGVERVRCSKVQEMLASRACRKSIMVGSALDRRQMHSVVKHMGETEQPWNCPHGRPTMRHLTTIPAPSPSHRLAWTILGGL